MKLAKLRLSDGTQTVGILEGIHVSLLAMDGGQFDSLSDILESENPAATAEFLINANEERLALTEVTLLPPIDRQEVWAAGVTYRRSKQARMEESETAATVYDRVYVAERPELFFKANARRVSGPNQPLRIRHDSKWNVPEPELALVLNSRMDIVGYTIGNDMSSRDIEGENPLYLPQAKVYDQCCGLGPCITLANAIPDTDAIAIALRVRRDGEVVFEEITSVRQMARPFDELVEYLGRDNSFPDGVMLLTGTGIVPPAEFTLVSGDVVEIAVDGIGVLMNPVVQG